MNTGICPHICLKDVFSDCITLHLSKRRLFRVFHRTSVLKMWTLGICPHIYLKDVYTGISLHISLKDASSGNFHASMSETRLWWASANTSILNMCTLGISLHIWLKDVLWVFPCISILKMCTAGICPHIYLKDVYATYNPSHLKMCFLGIFLHICFKHVYTGHLSAYIFKNVQTRHIPTHLS